MTAGNSDSVTFEPGQAVWLRTALDELIPGRVIDPHAVGGNRRVQWKAVSINSYHADGSIGWERVNWPFEDVFPDGFEPPNLPKKGALPA